MSKNEFSLGIRMTLAFITCCEAMSAAMMIIIIPFMVEFYLIVNNEEVTEEKISTKSGFVESSYRLTQVIAMLLWYFKPRSRVSARVGSRPIILLCLSGQLIFLAGVGMSRNYYLTLAMRALTGLFSGYMPIVKGLIRDIARDDNIAGLYSYVVIGASLSNVLGPFIGSFSNPADSFGFIFRNEFWVKFPYFLPFFLQALLTAFTLILAYKNIAQNKPVSSETVSTLQILTTRDFIVATGIYSLFGLAEIGMRLSFSLICKLSEELGGMGIDSESIASAIQGVAGIVAVFLSAILTTKLSEQFGLRKAMLVVLLAFIPCCLSISYFGEFTLIAKYLALAVVYGAMCGEAFIWYAYISICISNSVFSEFVTTANGISAAIMACSRFLAGAMFGSIFAWSISDGLDLPFVNSHFSFVLLTGIIALVMGGIYWLMGQSIERKKIRDHEVSLIDKKE
jgi:MFS family permease